MTNRTTNVTVRVQATIEFTVASAWGTSWTIGDVFRDANEQAKIQLNQMIGNRPYKVIKMETEMVLVPKEQQ